MPDIFIVFGGLTSDKYANALVDLQGHGSQPRVIRVNEHDALVPIPGNNEGSRSTGGRQVWWQGLGKVSDLASYVAEYIRNFWLCNPADIIGYVMAESVWRQVLMSEDPFVPACQRLQNRWVVRGGVAQAF